MTEDASATIWEALRRVYARSDPAVAHTPERIASMILSGDLQAFLVGPDSVIVAGLTKYGRAHIYAAAGKLRELVDALPGLERWYRLKGADLLTITGRKGWIRVLKPLGYRVAGPLLMKGLHNVDG